MPDRYELNKNLFRLYYLLVLTTVLQRIAGDFGRGLEMRSFAGLFKPFSFLLSLLSFDHLFIGFVLFTLLAIFSPAANLFRSLHALAFLLLFALIFSDGNVYHSSHIFFYVSIGLAFISPISTTTKQLTGVLWIWPVILINYSLSGVWKVCGIINQSSLITFSSDLSNVLPNHLAFAKAEGSLHLNPLQSFLIESSALGAVAWLSVIALELVAFLGLYNYQWRKTISLCLAALHVIIGITMGIWFIPNVLVLGFLLAYEGALISTGSAA